MNDDYDKHIIQKYRLALAIAIVKNTPENYTPKIYLDILKNNTSPEMEHIDPDMTVCEDDFDDDENNNIDENDKSTNDLTANNENQIFDSQTNDSMTILKDFDFNDMMRKEINDKGVIENNSVSQVLNILKGVDSGKLLGTEVSCINDNINSQSTYYENSQAIKTNELENDKLGFENNIEISNIRYTSQHENKNQIKDTLNRRKANVFIGSAENSQNDSQTNDFNNYTDHFTHVSQSQASNIVIARHFIEKERPKDRKSNLLDHQIKPNSNPNMRLENDVNGKNNILKQMNEESDNDALITNEVMIINEGKKHKFAPQDNNTIDNIQAKRSRNVDNNKHPQTDVIVNDASKIKLKNDIETEYTEPFKSLFKSNKDTQPDYNFNFDRSTQDSQSDKIINLDVFNSESSNESSKGIKLGYSSQAFSQFSEQFDSESNNTEAPISMALLTKDKTIADGDSEEQILDELFDKLTDSQSEVVPFKVLEELNKVKTFLNKQNRRESSDCVSDSGYKSDSHSRNAFKNASNVWLNQSAHCLLSYITQCPLAVNTEEITTEITKTLGRLIDRLHEEEKYPSFLEEHLHTVDVLLKEIYEDDSANKLAQKEQKIHRLFLLNKSSHIMKYTAEKIIPILEDLLSMLPNESLETSATVRLENLSYIFHVLETLIKKLIVHKSLSQRSTQNSQEDEVALKRSSITDIWRKKWNPSKSVVDSVSVKQCVLMRCGDVLNKVIVQAMDGYSLISYSALQCFNLLQN